MFDPSTLDDSRRNVLLSELRNWNESFWKNEEAGESRIKFYIALVTAVGGGLTALYQIGLRGEADAGGVQAPFQQLVPVALWCVLAFGLVTFARMVRRNQVTDEYKEWGDEIRRHLLGQQLFLSVYGSQGGRPRPRDRYDKAAKKYDEREACRAAQR